MTRPKKLTSHQYVRPRGTVIFIGLPPGAIVKAPVFESVVKMIAIKASYVGNRRDGTEAIEFFRRGLIKAPFKVVGLSELQKVYDLMVRNPRPFLFRESPTDSVQTARGEDCRPIRPRHLQVNKTYHLKETVWSPWGRVPAIAVGSCR